MAPKNRTLLAVGCQGFSGAKFKVTLRVGTRPLAAVTEMSRNRLQWVGSGSPSPARGHHRRPCPPWERGPHRPPSGGRGLWALAGGAPPVGRARLLPTATRHPLSGAVSWGLGTPAAHVRGEGGRWGGPPGAWLVPGLLPRVPPTAPGRRALSWKPRSRTAPPPPTPRRLGFLAGHGKKRAHLGLFRDSATALEPLP